MADHPNKLRVSWTIPAPVILAILAQAAAIIFAIGVWKSSIDSTLTVVEGRVSALERGAMNSMTLIERVKGVEVNVQGLKEQSQKIEDKLDKLIDRGSSR